MMKRVLITGGAGTLGHGLAKSLLPHVDKLIVLSRDYYKHEEMAKKYPDIEFFIGDVRDKERLYRAFKGVDTVIHAAALKDIDKCRVEPRECLLTNVMGSQNVIDAAIEYDVEKCLLISTDKAVEPTTTYGVSKLMAERLFLDSSVYDPNGTLFGVCRYGNVWCSNGSVVPKYLEMIKNGATSLPLTDLRMSRYMMLLEDAVDFVIRSLDSMTTSGHLFTPNLPSFWIKDLIEALGCSYYITGIRPNEKLAESMTPGENSSDNEWFLTVDDLRCLLAGWEKI